MPKYRYSCKKCGHNNVFSLKINEFKSLSSVDNFQLFCEECNSNDMVRILNPAKSKIERTKEDLVKIAKDEAIAITNKIKEGNQSYIRDIFGEK
tara:strand:+ start:5280 stop:5561 length:282 start_codon:yes stop_codon:yes gene_type:complete